MFDSQFCQVILTKVNANQCCQSFTIFWSSFVRIFNTWVSIDFFLNKHSLMRCFYLNFTNYRSIIVRKLREIKKTFIWLHHEHVHIIRQYTIMYLKITNLSTKQSFIEIYKRCVWFVICSILFFIFFTIINFL